MKNRSNYLLMIAVVFVCTLLAACGPVATAVPTNTVVPTNTITVAPTETNTPQPTATLAPTNTSTPSPTPTATPVQANPTETAKYFVKLVLTGMDGMTETTEFAPNGPYCFRHVAKAEVKDVSTAIFDLQTVTYSQKKGLVYDGKDYGIIKRGDWSSCTSLPDLKPGKYEFQIFVGDVPVGVLPFVVK